MAFEPSATGDGMLFPKSEIRVPDTILMPDLQPPFGTLGARQGRFPRGLLAEPLSIAA